MRFLIICLLYSSFTFGQKTYQKNFFDNGTIKSEGWIENNQKIDYWKFYYKNEVLQKEGHFLNDKETEFWYFYTESGTKKSEGHFRKGKKNKWWLFYDENEQINHKCQLKNNQKNGYCFHYKIKKIVKSEKYKAGEKLKEWTDFKSFRKENSLKDINANN